MAGTRVLVQRWFGNRWRTVESFDYQRDRRDTSSGYRLVQAELKKYQDADPKGKFRISVRNATGKTVLVLGAGAFGVAAQTDTAQAEDAVQRMLAAAPDFVRKGTKITSGYRSIERQKQLFDAAVKKYGSVQAARRYVAPPGKSQHNFGTAADLSMTPDAKKWIHANAEKYGLTFPLSWEPWHIEIQGARKAEGARKAAPTPDLIAEGARRIGAIESGGSGGYKALGPVHPRTGDRAYGKYQVMGQYIPEWSKAALGRSLTPEQFLSSPDAQEAVFRHRFGGYLEKYGNLTDAASVWFTGRPEAKARAQGAKDFAGTTIDEYLDRLGDTTVYDKQEEPYQRREDMSKPEALARIAVSETLKTPYYVGFGLPALVGTGIDAASRKLGFGDPHSADWWRDALAASTESVHRSIGIDEPKDFLEAVVGLAPGAMVRAPIKAGEKAAQTLTELLTPVTTRTAPLARTGNVATQTAVYDALRHYTDQDNQYTSLPEFAERIPDVEPQMEVKEAGLSTGNVLSDLLLASLALAGGVKGAKYLRAQKQVAPTVINPAGHRLPKTLTTLETPGDYWSTIMTSPVILLKNTLARSGAPAHVVEAFARNTDLLTHNAGKQLVNSFVRNGEVYSPAGNATVSVAPGRLASTIQRMPRTQRDAFKDLLRTWDALDQLKLFPRAKVGMSKRQATSIIANIENSYPHMTKMRKAFHEIVDAVRQFEAQGEYATLARKTKGPGKSLLALQKLQPHWYPFEFDPTVGMSFGERLASTFGKDIGAGKPGLRRVPIPVNKPSRDPMQTLLDRIKVSMTTRFENEVIGRYVDTLRKSPHGASTLRPVTAKELRLNPEYRENLIAFTRRGKTEMYIGPDGVADVARFDPFVIQGAIPHILYATKRAFEFGTTGLGNPPFAFLSAWRDWRLLKQNLGDGWKRPRIIGSLYSIPRQLTPLAARAMSNAIYTSLDAGSNGFMIKLLGKPRAQALAGRLADTFHNSMQHLVETHGGLHVSIMEGQYRFQIKFLRDLANDHTLPRWIRAAYHGYAEILHSIHTSAKFHGVVRSVKAGRDPAEAVAVFRTATGDVSMGGISRVTGASGKKRAIRSSPTSGALLSGITRTAVRPLAEVGRIGSPWWNPMVQGIASYGKAYARAPIKHTLRGWAYAGSPVALAYLWNTAIGTDPSGNRYVDFQMGRNDYRKTMYPLYFGIPGRHVQEGLQTPFAHEQAIYGRLALEAIDFMFRPFLHEDGFARDAAEAVSTWLGIIAVPATPPLADTGLGLLGAEVISGRFSGGSPEVRVSSPNVDNQHLNRIPENIELAVRGLIGPLGETVGLGVNAYMQDEGTLIAGLKEMGREVVKGLPGSEVFGVKTYAPDRTDMWRKRDAIEKLAEFYTRWDPRHKERAPGEFSTEPYSGAGRAINRARGMPETGGMTPAPLPIVTNQLYIRFAQSVYDYLRKDSAGFRDLWTLRGHLNRKVNAFRGINFGNMPTYASQILADPDSIRIATEYGFDPLSRGGAQKILNVWISERDRIDAQIMAVIQQVEAEMTRQMGFPVKLEDLDWEAKGPVSLPATAPSPATP